MKSKVGWLALALGWAISAGASPADLDALVQGNTAFALDLHAQLRSQSGNLFYSPYSLSSALAMTYAGARENTAAEMQAALRFNLGPAATHPAFAALQSRLGSLQKAGGVQLAMANSLWPQKGHPFLPEYLSRLEEGYGSAITPLDFEGATEPSRQTINRWVEEKTRDKIRDLIEPGGLDPLTRLVLVNAIYFKGDWESPFDPAHTEEAAFWVSPDAEVRVPMMTQTHRFPYAEFDDCQIVKLPYAGGGLSMLVVLPREKDGLKAIEDRLAPGTIGPWREALFEREVCVFLPKFKMTWGAVALNKPLQALGMVDAFRDTRADFSGMDGQPQGLYIGLVLHKAFVEVNEEGTEAAAATAVTMTFTAARPPSLFRADHPFLFLIQDDSTGSILFLGRVADPAKTE